jgi:immune inhibitor A
MSNPDYQLNDWPNDPDATSPNYGASFLFMTYFLDRFGENVTKAVVADPENGLTSIDGVMAQFNYSDELTGKSIRADDIFIDWTLANYLKDKNIADGRYTYHNYPDSPQADNTESVRTCDSTLQTRDVHQYGADYIYLKCKGKTTLRFEGSLETHLLPADPNSGKYAFWSNKGDESDMNLTHSFDFSDYPGPLTLSYWTWYDIEKDFDYVYLEVSLDGGEHWQIINTPSGTDTNPTGANYGWGYSGLSGNNASAKWIQETVDISMFAGKNVQIRFDYITDAEVNGEGFLLDDISIPEINYFSDFENNDGGWQANGFARIENRLPQTFRIALITIGETTTVNYIPLETDNSASISLDFNDIREAVLVVTGTTRFTRQLAAYQFYFPPQ